MTVTVGRSYDDISTKLGAGEEFEGWRYATATEISTFFDAFGGSGTYTGWSVANNGLFDEMHPYWGDTFCISYNCNTGDGAGRFIFHHPATSLPYLRTGQVAEFANQTKRAQTEDYVEIFWFLQTQTTTDPTVGSALIRVIPTPVPAAVWLFGTGLLALIGVARRKTRT